MTLRTTKLRNGSLFLGSGFQDSLSGFGAEIFGAGEPVANYGNEIDGNWERKKTSSRLL